MAVTDGTVHRLFTTNVIGPRAAINFGLLANTAVQMIIMKYGVFY